MEPDITNNIPLKPKIKPLIIPKLPKPKIKPLIIKKTQPYYCYLIHSCTKNRTYNGSTNSLKRRIRQHNGELVGGAKSTTSGRPWTYFAVLTGFPNHGNCLSCEWRIRNPESGLRALKYRGIEGRVKGLDLILKRKQWTKPCVDKNKDMKLHLWIIRPYEQLLNNIPSNITVYPVDTIDIVTIANAII